MTYQQTSHESNILLAYIRKSRIEDDATPSPASQRAAIERWNQDHGQHRLEWFQDLDLSKVNRQLAISRVKTGRDRDDELDRVVASINRMLAKLSEDVEKEKQYRLSLKESEERYRTLVENIDRLAGQVAAHAPAAEANRLANSELPPTAALIHADGITPSWPGRPRSSPVTSTPARRSGRICFA